MNFFSKTKNLEVLQTEKKKKNWIRYCQFFLGCFIVAFSYNMFIASNDLVPGGVGGIAVITNNLFGFDNSLTIFVVNIFLLILSYILLGWEKTRSTIFGSILFPIFVKLTEHANVWIQFDTSKILLMAIIGGFFFGLGAGLIFKAGFTTGGTDIINQIISKYGKMSMGKSMLLSDGLIVILSGVFFGVTSMLYSILILYMISIISDRIVLGISNNKMFYIITDQEKEIKDYILNDLHHGATIFKAKGGRDTQYKKVIMTALPTKDFYDIKEGIEQIDHNAFFIVTDAYELFGGE
ncbi:MAG: YitT family protein [Bacilli bacterium]|nr:YitT family protein [Bacilli bacterium]